MVNAFPADVWLVLKGTETNFLICNICALWQILTSLLLSQCWRGGSKVSSFSIPSVSQPFWPPTNRMQFQWTQKTLFQFRDFCTFLRHLLSRQRWINFSRQTIWSSGLFRPAEVDEQQDEWNKEQEKAWNKSKHQSTFLLNILHTSSVCLHSNTKI